MLETNEAINGTIDSKEMVGWDPEIHAHPSLRPSTLAKKNLRIRNGHGLKLGMKLHWLEKEEVCIPEIPDLITDVRRELAKVLSVESEDIMKAIPTKLQARKCNPHKLNEEENLSMRNYYLIHFHKHRNQIPSMKNIIRRLSKNESDGKSYIHFEDIMPQALRADKIINGYLKNFNGNSQMRRIREHSRTASKLLLESAFLYPIVHTIIEESPIDTLTYLRQITLDERNKGHHINFPDRIFVRRVSEVILSEDFKKSNPRATSRS